MTLNEIISILYESDEEGILIELPNFSSSERLYLMKTGELYHLTQFGKNRAVTELMSDEIKDDRWIIRDWDEHSINDNIKTSEEHEKTLLPKQLLEYFQNWEPTPEQFQELINVIKEMEIKFEQQEKDSQVTDEILNKRFTL